MHSSKLTLERLMNENCLLFGNKSKLTSKKIAKYLLGKRDTIEIFKLYELRYLLLKIYPLIHNLFYNPRPNPEFEVQKFLSPPEKSADGSLLAEKPRWPFKNKGKILFKWKSTPPQILFASVTPMYSNILSKAAQICNMPWHNNRWLSGSITAAISYPSDKLLWQFLQDTTQTKIGHSVFTQWNKNKESKEKIDEKIKHGNRSRWPSLIVIPDVSNNIMILKEARKIGLPVIGLINSHCFAEIDYPIFAQDAALQSVHFFCHFLALLIAKETFFLQHKRYTLQKNWRKVNKKPIGQEIKTEVKTQILFRDNEETKNKKFVLETGIACQRVKQPWRRPFFFEKILPWQKKFTRRFFLPLNFSEYLPLWLKKYYYRTFKRKRHFSFSKINLEVKQRKLKLFWEKKTINQTWPLKKKLKNTSPFFNLRPTLKPLIFKRRKTLNLLKKKPKKQKTYFKWEWKGLESLWSAKELYRQEYAKKYLQKNKQTLLEKEQLLQGLRNFGWFYKINRSLAKRRRFFYIPFSFRWTPHYFRQSLHLWSQRIKWHAHRYFTSRFLLLKADPEQTKMWRQNKWKLWVKNNKSKTFSKNFTKYNSRHQKKDETSTTTTTFRF